MHTGLSPISANTFKYKPVLPHVDCDIHSPSYPPHVLLSALGLFCTQLAPGPVQDGRRAIALLCRVGLQWQWTCLQWRIVGETHTYTQNSHCCLWTAITWQLPCFLLGEKKAFLVHQVQSWSAKKQRGKVKLEVGPGQVAFLPFHHMDYHLLLHQGALSADVDVQRLIFFE